MNFLVYTRGNKKDYDSWKNLGNYGWGYKDVLPYFTKSENCSICTNVDEEYHGKQGYLSISHCDFKTPIFKEFLRAGSSLGYDINDPNGRNNVGFSEVQATMRNGRRCSAAKAYLNPIFDRENLRISIGSRVVKILIDPVTKTAYGVRFVKNNKKYVVRAKKEIILSGGTFNSPHLLMVSGVGPKKDLEKFNITVLSDLKVGYNLQDHFQTSTLLFLVNESVTISDTNIQNPYYFYQYLAGI